MDNLDPRQLLARHLRALREDRWPEMKITQPQLARALGGNQPLSVPLISSWESLTNPKIPPYQRIEAYATLFATRRSLERGTLHLLKVTDLTEDERRVMDELKRELTRLRNSAMQQTSPIETGQAALIAESLSSGHWRFADGNSILIVCAQLPGEMLSRMPYSDPLDPDYVALYSYSDLDALVELHGHLRATNPANQVDFRTSSQLPPDAYTAHLVVLGGTDWNIATRSIISRLRLPVRQIADWESPDGQYFEVEENGRAIRHRPRLEQSGDRSLLREDIALFARATNPFNRRRTVTLCHGMYGSGTYGAVRALTDARFRDRNTAYLRSRFGGSDSYCVLTRVQVENGAALTPDWTIADYRLFEWSRSNDEGPGSDEDAN